jgi:hypothetical protein
MDASSEHADATLQLNTGDVLHGQHYTKHLFVAAQNLGFLT